MKHILKKSNMFDIYVDERRYSEDVYCIDYIEESELEEWEKGFMKGYLNC